MKKTIRILSLVLAVMLIFGMNTLAAGVLQGDANDDGKLNSADAIYLLRHTVFPSLYPVNQGIDMNGDGLENSADAIYLLRHTVFPANYPLKNGVADCEHKEVIDAALAPTCTETGLTEGKHCSECGFILIAQEPVPALGHRYENEKCSVCGATPQPSENLAYTLSEDGTYYIVSGLGECTDTYIVIPAEHEGLPVKTIKNKAFKYQSQIHNVKISDGITEIGDDTFQGCYNLESVVIADSVTKIGIRAFFGNSALTKIILPNELTEIADWTFDSCRNLKEIQLPENLRLIGKDAFDGCRMLETIAIPESVETIGNSAFRECTSLTDITLPSSLTKLSDYIFYGCTALTTIEIPETVTEIGASAFENCTFTNIDLPDGLKKIGNDAFRSCENLQEIVFPVGLEKLGSSVLMGCISLETVEIPEGITEIGSHFFSSCTSLTKVKLPLSLTTIGYWAFENCYALETILFAGSEGDWHSVQKTYAWDETTGDFDVICLKQPVAAHNLAFTLSGDGTYYIVSGIGECTEKDLIIPAVHNELPVLELAENAFKDVTSLITVKMENGILHIGNGAFRGCNAMISIELPESVTKIGADAFRNCSSLTSISLPEGMTTLEKGVFAYCYKLKTVYLPDHILSIGDEAFYSCGELNMIVLPQKLQHIGADAFHYGALKTLTLPEGLQSIGANAFTSNDFTEITIPESVKTIGEGAFTFCDQMTSIDLLSGISAIPPKLFWECSSLTNVTIPSNVTSIGDSAFYHCRSLTVLVIPKTILELGNNLFGEETETPTVTGLSIVYEGSRQGWFTVEKPASWDAGADYIMMFLEDDEERKDIQDPFSYRSTYAYDYLGTLPNNFSMQGLYMAIDVFASAFHISDIDVSAESEGVIGILDYGILGLTDEEAQAVWTAYYYDHPLYYWMARYLAQMDGQLYLFVDEAYYSASVRNDYNEKIYQKVSEWTSLTANETSSYQIAMAYHNLILTEIDYAYKSDGVTPEDAVWAHNIIGVFNGGGKGVCESYARAFQLLLNYSDVENVYVVGDAYGGHAWNMARLDDGNWYWFDLTWDDDPSFAWGIRYCYFGVNSTQNINWYYQDGGYIIDNNGDHILDDTTFTDEHTPDPVTTKGMEFMYPLPAISGVTYNGDLRNTFSVNGLSYAISGYHTVQLTGISNTGYVQIPETVTYGGVTYTVTSIGDIRNDGIYSKQSIRIYADSIYIPKTVKYIWEDTFADASDVEITVDSENPYYYSVNGDIYMRSLYIIRQNTKNIHIPKKQLEPAA